MPIIAFSFGTTNAWCKERHHSVTLILIDVISWGLRLPYNHWPSRTVYLRQKYHILWDHNSTTTFHHKILQNFKEKKRNQCLQLLPWTILCMMEIQIKFGKWVLYQQKDVSEREFHNIWKVWINQIITPPRLQENK